MEQLSVPPNLQIQSVGQGINHRNPDTVETTGNLVGSVVELAAGMENGEDYLGRRLPFGGMDIGRDATAVVDHGYGTVQVDGDIYFVAVAGQGFVNGVVDDLVHQVVETWTKTWSRYTWPDVSVPPRALQEP